MKRLIKFLLLALPAYLLVICFVPLLDRLVLFPSTYPIDAMGAIRRTVPFNGGEVEMWTAASAKARLTSQTESYVLRFYGNADRPEHWVAAEAETFSDRAIEVWGVNYPGFGGSSGPSRLATLGPAVVAAFDEMKREAGERPIIVSGSSFGTIAALHIAAERPVTGLILHNPPALPEMVRANGWWNLWLLATPLSYKVPAALDSVANARRAHAPAVFLLAERDEVVAPKFQSLVLNAYAGEKRVISLPDAFHNSPIEHAAMETLRHEFEWLMGRTETEQTR